MDKIGVVVAHWRGRIIYEGRDIEGLVEIGREGYGDGRRRRMGFWVQVRGEKHELLRGSIGEMPA